MSPGFQKFLKNRPQIRIADRLDVLPHEDRPALVLTFMVRSILQSELYLALSKLSSTNTLILGAILLEAVVLGWLVCRHVDNVCS